MSSFFLEKSYIEKIDAAESVINERRTSVMREYEKNGVSYSRIPYEEISLTDILDNTLVPLMPFIIDNYNGLNKKTRQKAYRVYVATLCEVVKNGLVGGGINKTIEARIGAFNLNNHYSLLKTALRYEGIEVSKKHRKYEETIINEAGIPRGYHRKCLELFLIYWKWMHNYDLSERTKFLSDCLNGNPIDRLYIVDSYDKQRFSELIAEVTSFSEKIIRTCKKLGDVFTAIDDYPDDITEQNIDEVAETISNELGFNIYAVIKSKYVKQYILAYAKKVSFFKFEQITSNLPDSETITLPTKVVKTVGSYRPSCFLGGRHFIRGNAYDVSFPIPLEIEDIYKLERNHPYLFGSAVLYTSEEEIWVERDGFERPYRNYYHDQYGLLNVYYERVAPASFTYIDGLLISNNEPFTKKIYVCKYWNRDLKHYQLGFCIEILKYADVNNPMRQVQLVCNRNLLQQGTTNRHGFFQISDKVIPFDDFDELPNNAFDLQLVVNDELVESWKLDLADLYIWGIQSGNRIRDNIDLSEWYGSTKIIIFSKRPNRDASIELSLLYEESGYSVYEGQFDKDAGVIELFGETIHINKPVYPYIELLSECTLVSGEYCINETDPIAIEIHNVSANSNDLVLVIEHESDHVSYNYNNLPPNALQNLRMLIPRRPNLVADVGKWSVSLFDHGIKRNTIQIIVLPTLTLETTKPIYKEGEPVFAIIKATDDCFENEGIYVNNKQVELGMAKIVYAGGFVFAEQIEYDCFIDRCSVYDRLTVYPEVWNVQARSIKSGDSLDISSKSIDVNELNDYGVYVCSTCNMSVFVRANGISEIKHIKPGLNYIDIKSFLYDAEAKTTVSITDEYGASHELTVIYKDSIDIISIEDDKAMVSINAKYHGPINTTIDFRVFSGKNLIYTNQKKAYRNTFTVLIGVEKRRFTNEVISIEARSGLQDFRQVYVGEINPITSKETHERITLSKTTTTVELLQTSFNPYEPLAFDNKLMPLLMRGDVS